MVDESNNNKSLIGIDKFVKLFEIFIKVDKRLKNNKLIN